MKLIASGKRKTTNKLIDVFAEKNNFTSNEKKHFTHLSLHHKAKTELQKKIHFEAVHQTLDSSINETLIQNYAEFVSSPTMPLLQLLIAFESVDRTAKQLAILTGQTLKQTQDDLKTLESLGVAYSEKNIWKTKFHSFKVPEKAQSKALKKYHINNLKEAQVIVAQDHLQRRFRSIMFALNDKNFPELVDDVESFLTKLKNKYETVKNKNDRVYKLSLQTYPITRPFV
jgi:uncharacterized protein (TIGR02147 family)